MGNRVCRKQCAQLERQNSVFKPVDWSVWLHAVHGVFSGTYWFCASFFVVVVKMNVKINHESPQGTGENHERKF